MERADELAMCETATTHRRQDCVSSTVLSRDRPRFRVLGIAKSYNLSFDL